MSAVELSEPEPEAGQILVRVNACGVCRTDLHLLDGEVEIPSPPIVPGHQIVGTVVARGEGPEGNELLEPGTRVGIPWLGWNGTHILPRHRTNHHRVDKPYYLH